MEPFIKHQGSVVAMERVNIDTDQIIPKQFLKKLSKIGFGKYLFFDWRFLEDGGLNPDFILNKPKHQGASILVAGDNFGCGSSREHAPWALLDYGIRVIISTSFADIFSNNCYKNGILPIVVKEELLEKLFAQAKRPASVEFMINLEQQSLSDADGVISKFNIEARQKEFLLKGLDDIKWTLQFKDKISTFENRQKVDLPWLWLN
ncbi:MAG: 3-isopropylmalate dehydratase small subunit [SAR324 cluster bacterium]|nr:3-isopropylmalate dehydratase small subunit [SAR324 cluster bacterium]